MNTAYAAPPAETQFTAGVSDVAAKTGYYDTYIRFREAIKDRFKDEIPDAKPYFIYGSRPEKLKAELAQIGKNFGNVLGSKNIIIISAGDEIEIAKRNRQILEIQKQGRFAAVLSPEDLAEPISKSESFTDKRLISIGPLSEDVSERFQKNCGKIAPSFLVGTKEYAGNTYDAIVSAQLIHGEEPDVAKALLSAAIESQGRAGTENRNLLNQFSLSNIEIKLGDILHNRVMAKMSERNWNDKPGAFFSNYFTEAAREMSDFAHGRIETPELISIHEELKAQGQDSHSYGRRSVGVLTARTTQAEKMYREHAKEMKKEAVMQAKAPTKPALEHKYLAINER